MRGKGEEIVRFGTLQAIYHLDLGAEQAIDSYRQDRPFQYISFAYVAESLEGRSVCWYRFPWTAFPAVHASQYQPQSR